MGILQLILPYRTPSRRRFVNTIMELRPFLFAFCRKHSARLSKFESAHFALFITDKVNTDDLHLFEHEVSADGRHQVELWLSRKSRNQRIAFDADADGLALKAVVACEARQKRGIKQPSVGLLYKHYLLNRSLKRRGDVRDEPIHI